MDITVAHIGAASALCGVAGAAAGVYATIYARGRAEGEQRVVCARHLEASAKVEARVAALEAGMALAHAESQRHGAVLAELERGAQKMTAAITEIATRQHATDVASGRSEEQMAALARRIEEIYQMVLRLVDREMTPRHGYPVLPPDGGARR